MLIGLTGALRSGKDTSCTLLQEIIKENHADAVGVRDAFADRLKVSAMRSLFGEMNHGEDVVKLANDLKEHGTIGITVGDHYHEISGRQYLQFYGTEGHRDVFGFDFWIEAVIPEPKTPVTYGRQDLQGLVEEGVHPILIVTDVRYDNEAQAVRNAGGYVWEIQRPQPKTEESTHKSEKPISRELVDNVILNDGSIGELRAKLQERLAALIPKPVHSGVNEAQDRCRH